jgi:DNA processing protein
MSIVSGLALGIDASAHKAALDAGGVTIGVLGCGLDQIYPVSNYQLGKEMIEKGGAIISEFPIGTPPMKYNFPARNRIIAGLSVGTLVVEAAEQSGALITAYQSLEYNREVFAVPGDIDSIQSAGTNKLIQNGAKMVLSPEDIFNELNIEVKKSETKAKEMLPESEDEKKIVSILSAGEKLVDEIIVETKLNVIIVNTSLTTLEMKGIVENMGGGRFKLR